MAEFSFRESLALYADLSTLPWWSKIMSALSGLGVTIWGSLKNGVTPVTVTCGLGVFAFALIIFKALIIKSKSLKLILNKEFRNEHVEIDGCEFVDCFFDNVIFVYRGGIYKFSGMKTPTLTTIGAKYLNDSAQGAVVLQGILKEFEEKSKAVGHKVEIHKGHMENEKRKNN